MSTKYDELDRVHEQLIEEEEVKTSDLPSNVKKKIKGWNLLEKRLKKNPDDERLFISIQKKSVEIADNIQDYIESELENEDNEEGKGSSSDNATDNDNEGSSSNRGNDGGGKSSDSDKDADKDADKDNEGSSSKSKKNKGFGNLVMEKKILAKMKENHKRISERELKEIIGKSPDYPEQKVHNIRLRKAFFSSEYRLI